MYIRKSKDFLMNNVKVKSDSNGYFLEIAENPHLYLKDAKGTITTERFPWIEKFLGVKIITDGYELLYRLKKGEFAKWTIDSFGVKQGQKNLQKKSLDAIAQEFQVDINSLSKEKLEELKRQEKANKYHTKAKLYYQLGKHDKAESFYYKAAMLSTNNYQLVNELAKCCTIQLKLKQALEAYMYLAIKYPDRELDIWHLKSKLIAHLNHTKDETVINYFIEIFERIVLILKKRSKVLELLGQLYWLKGEKTRALELKLLASNEKTLNQKKLTSLRVNSLDISKVNFKMPDFLVIGPQKSGTTALYKYLTEHPHIYPASAKEIFFFDIKYDHGIDWYRSHFPVLPEFTYLTGEASATYFNDLQALERIAELLPKVKLIFIIRDPVDRAISDYYMKVRNGVESRSIEEAIISEIEFLNQESVDFLNPDPKFFHKHKGYVRNGLYFYFLKTYMNMFKSQNMTLINSEKLLHSPRETMKTVFDFLGVEDFPGKYPLINKGNYSKKTNRLVLNELSKFFKNYNLLLEELIEVKLNWQ